MTTQSAHDQRKNSSPSGSNSSPHPGHFSLGSAESRAAARALLSRQPITIVDFGTLPTVLPSYGEILRDWKDEGDRYTEETMRDKTLFRCSVLKDSDAFRRLKEDSAK
jgi:hypothetical protein